LGYFGTPQKILEAPQDKLVAVSGIGYKIANKIKNFKKEALDKELKLAAKLGIKILLQDNMDYPQNLKNIIDPPIVLYLKGDLKEEDKFSIAIVGSRRASFYGLSCAERFAADLARQNLTIVSGMARGIDTSAHQGALKAGGRTIAIIGSGLNRIYPPENEKLAEEISRNGAVISEFPLDTEPFKQNFPRRNRVISGLSLGVLVVEAARNSGALITCDFALEQAREVFALPGKIDSDNSFGTNELIKQGAKLVSHPDEILEEFNIGIYEDKKNLMPKPGNLPLAESPVLCEKESVVYNCIKQEPISFDAIIEDTRCAVPEASAILLKLQMKKMIKQLPGKHFARRE